LTVQILVHTVSRVTVAWFDEVAIPALLRAARRAYGSAVRAALAEAGCDDMPRNGSYVVGAIDRTGAPLSQIITELGVSKQAAGQLVDTLVARGYLERSPDPDDRRRLTITLTERGHAAAATVRAAVEQVDAALLDAVGAEYVAHTRATLGALIQAGAHHPHGPHGD
jgi:DNA-binding MarR family transcriptional regulator